MAGKDLKNNVEDSRIVNTNIVFDHINKNLDKTGNFKKRIIVEQGGTRSGKTWNILTWLIIHLINKKGLTVDIVRKTMPSLKISAMQDLFDILKNLGMYDSRNHNRSDNKYVLNGNTIRFLSMDDPQKKRGPGRDILFLNEANELTHEDFKQLNMRTRQLIIIDYNPSDEFHWIYDHVIPRDDCLFFQTTYKDNPFLLDSQVKEIERFKDIDPNYWKIYGLGERGVGEATIYRNYELTDMKKPEGEEYYGLDFGFNHPNALINIVIFDDEDGGGVWVDEVIYKSGLTTPDLIKEMDKKKVPMDVQGFADSSRPETIEEIHRAGYNIHPYKKGPGSVKAGIDHIKRYKLFVTKRSTNLYKELKSYKWKIDKNERILDEPVKINDDAVDALRYAFGNKIGIPEDFFDAESLDVVF